tara:strand:+ start:496794 stop:497567 length:774 start_codon:yes stop_codon:yes gene_type:complete
MPRREAFKQRVMIETAASLPVLIPTVLGVTAGIAGIITTPLVAAGGGILVLIGGGIWATRMMSPQSDIHEKTWKKMAEEEERKEQARLDALSEHLEQDGDHRTESALSDMRQLIHSLKTSELSANVVQSEGIVDKAERLFEASVDMLEKTLGVNATISGLSRGSSARARLEEQREHMVTEVLTNVDRLSSIVAKMQTLGATGDFDSAEGLRAELESDLEIVAEVEEQTRRWARGDFSPTSGIDYDALAEEGELHGTH